MWVLVAGLNSFVIMVENTQDGYDQVTLNVWV